MENNWIENVSGECPVLEGVIVDVLFRNGAERSCEEAGSYSWYSYGEPDDIVSWRMYKPEQSLDDALGNTIKQPVFEYPQTNFKPSSEAQLRADEAARISNKLSEKLSTIADTASKLTRKNFSVADIKLVKDLLESVEEYEENR